MPPIHPAIVHYPIALVTLSVIADLLGYLFKTEALKVVGWWALIAAAIGAAFALVAGLFDMTRAKVKDEVHKRVHTHMKIGFTLFAAIAGLTIWRWFIYTDTTYQLRWSYLVPALLVLGLTFFQGWLGGELVFAHGVGVARASQGTEPARKASESLRKTSGTSEEHHEH